MPLKTVNKLPPGGWVYDQKGPDGKVIKKFKSMSPFKEACLEIQRFRQNNSHPRTDLSEVMDDVEEFQCARLGYDPSVCVSKKKTARFFSPSQIFQASASHLRESVEAAGRRISQAMDGSAILKDWLGDGGIPVPKEQSQARADICSGRLTANPCPFNVAGFAPIEAVAEAIKQQTEEKNKLNLRVEGEENLKSCDLCWCPLPLKVHVPMSYIVSKTPAKMLAKFRQAQPACWMNTENQNPA
jgi:uncharacterized protein (UPF0218 family)